jgi:hypothetical protein
MYVNNTHPHHYSRSLADPQQSWLMRPLSFDRASIQCYTVMVRLGHVVRQPALLIALDGNGMLCARCELSESW